MERLNSALPFLEAMESLKILKRAGWQRRGVPDSESVSDHMYRMTFVCMAHPELVHDIDRFECLHQALMYHKRCRGLQDFSEFRTLREKISDPWLVTQADLIIREWDAQRERSKMDIIFMVGGLGVGKGTQCARIVDEFDFEHISVGDLLREEQDKPESAFGDFIRESIQNSVIVPPSLTMILLKDRIQGIQARGKGVLVDGFPRSVGQAEAFDQEISDTYSTIDLDCSPDAMIERVKKRSESSHRDDDNLSTLEKRLKTFKDSNAKVLGYLSKNNFYKVDCAASADEVYKTVRNVVKEALDK